MEGIEGRRSEAYLLGARSPALTIVDLASKQLASYAVQSVVLILMPFLATSAIENKKATLAAISVAGPFEYLSQMCGWFLQIGGCATMSGFLGRGRVDDARALLAQMFVVGWALTALIIAVLVPSLRAILGSLVDREQGDVVIEYAWRYIVPYLCSAPLVVTYYILLSVFMACGKMGFYLGLQIFQQTLCCGVLCPALLFATDLGIWAPAIAFGVSFVPACVVAFAIVQTKTPLRIDLRLVRERAKWVHMKECVGVGVIDLISSSSGMIVMGTVQSLISQIGMHFSAEFDDVAQRNATYEAVLAAWGCLSRFYQIVIGVCYSTTGSYLSAASFALGSGRHTRFFQLSVVICVLTCAISLAVTLAIIGAAKYISLLFGDSPLYVELATMLLRIFCITGVILPLQFIVTTFCQAIQYIGIGIAIALVTQVMLVPVLFVVLYNCTRHLEPRANYYLCMMSFNLNDVISGVISVAAMALCLRRFTRQFRVRASWRVAFSPRDDAEETKVV